MPGRLYLTRGRDDLARDLAPAPGLADLPALTPRRNIAPGQEVLALTPDGPAMMRWGLIPVGRVNARGRPVMETIVNARSETVFDKSAFRDVGRCLVPVDGWYEWTGEKRRKTAWRIRRKDGQPIVFAAIWDRWTAPGGQSLDQLATVTCDPSGDVVDIHHRMGVIVEPADFETWLSGGAAAATALMRPFPNGRLVVEQADDVDWQGV